MNQHQRLVAAMTAVSAVIYTERTAVSIAAPSIMRDSRLSETQMGSVFSAFYVAYTVSMFAGGALCDRFGPRRTLSFGILGSALFAALTGLCGLPIIVASGGGFFGLIAARLGSGASAAPLFPSCAKLTGNWFPAAMTARVQAILFGTTLLGVALLPVVGTPIIARFGWTSVFAGLTAMLACAFAVWRSVVRDFPHGPAVPKEANHTLSCPPSSCAPSYAPPYSPLSGTVLLLTCSYAALCYFIYLLESWAFYYFREVRRFGPAESALYVSGMLMAGAVMGPAGGWLSDLLSIRCGSQIGRRAVPIAGILLSVALCSLGAAGRSPLITAAALAVSYGVLVACDAIFWAVTIEATGGRAGTACGLLNTGGNFGGILAPVITPMIAARYGWTTALWFGGAVALLAVAPWLSRRTVRATSSRPAVMPVG